MSSENIPTFKKRHDWSQFFFKFILLFPAFIMLIVFMYYPIIEVFRISMTRSTGLGPEVYIGLNNYIKLFTSENFLAGLLHVFQWAFWSIVIQIPLAFFIAYACTNYRNKFVKSLRSVYYLGNVLPSAITAMLGMFIFMPNAGIIVSFSKLVNWKWLERIDFLGNPNLAFWSLFGVATWAYIGFGIIYFMANIEQIPEELREAAVIDGANKWQFARYIVIPQISYALSIQVILCTVGSLKLFDLPWLITKGGPGDYTTTLGIILYQEGWINSQYGKGAAVGVIIFLLSLIFTVIQFSRTKTVNN